ncbi:MAG TPA: type II secretion system protein [Candidatus Saccharimonadales bacterium]|nr:type II secretion system protein [Candidatus Saccharimonadales bacterium]
MRANHSRQGGFTLLELVVVGGVLLACIGIMLVMIRPADYDYERRNASRRLDLALLLLAITDYETREGKLPPSITAEETPIATNEEGKQNLCNDLVPTYLDDVPHDPLLNVKAVADKTCADPDQYFMSGYTVSKDDNGWVTLSAPGTEKDPTIIVKRWFSIL